MGEFILRVIVAAGIGIGIQAGISKIFHKKPPAVVIQQVKYCDYWDEQEHRLIRIDGPGHVGIDKLPIIGCYREEKK